MIPYDNEWFYGNHHCKNGGHYAFALYGALQYITPYSEESNTMFCMDMIKSLIRIEEDNRTHMKHLKEALKYLHEQELIKFYLSALSQEEVEVDTEKLKGKTLLYVRLNVPTSRMTLIKYTDIEKILFFNEDEPIHKLMMYSQFGAIIYHINQERKIAFPSLKQIGLEANIGSETTVIKFNRRLVELEVLIYKNAGTKSRTNSNVTGESNGNVSNTYARPEHQFQLDMHITKEQEEHRAKAQGDAVRVKGNDKRRYQTTIYHARKAIANTTDEKVIAEKQQLIDVNIALYMALTGEHPDS